MINESVIELVELLGEKKSIQNQTKIKNEEENEEFLDKSSRSRRRKRKQDSDNDNDEKDEENKEIPYEEYSIELSSCYSEILNEQIPCHSLFPIFYLLLKDKKSPLLPSSSDVCSSLLPLFPPSSLSPPSFSSFPSPHIFPPFLLQSFLLPFSAQLSILVSLVFALPFPGFNWLASLLDVQRG